MTKFEEGKCPKCGGELTYTGDGCTDYDNGETCNVVCPACGFEGAEFYRLEFAGFDDAEGNVMPPPKKRRKK